MNSVKLTELIKNSNLDSQVLVNSIKNSSSLHRDQNSILFGENETTMKHFSYHNNGTKYGNKNLPYAVNDGIFTL